MIRHGFEALFLACVASMFATSTSADDYDDFRAKYEIGARTISESMEHVKGRIQVTSFAIDQRGKRTERSRTEGEFAVSGENGKVVLNKSIAPSLKVHSIHSRAEGSRFSVEKLGLAIVSISHDQSTNLGKTTIPIDWVELNCDRYLKSSYLFMRGDILKILESPNWQRPVLHRIERDGKPILSLKTAGVKNDGSYIEFEFDPASRYRVLKSVMKTPNGLTINFEIEYDPKHPEIDVPQRVRYFDGGTDDVYEFSDLRFEKTPVEEFRSEFFGVTADSVTFLQRLRSFTWLFCLAFAALVFLALRISKRRAVVVAEPVI